MELEGFKMQFLSFHKLHLFFAKLGKEGPEDNTLYRVYLEIYLKSQPLCSVGHTDDAAVTETVLI